ncbi:polyamine-modulated factor 1-binding protein 1 isoform X2 [Mastomys coucha]|uniref:polyamine-modulated factor 1-binding protein 1 isoform X2 n=1 Tax=Mastomys coucha TaxID=35658 RepID=UPI001261828D|nr:polyamine-modulated factor 1-binding protein 1 isoform X2 [Mastomys coucha]
MLKLKGELRTAKGLKDEAGERDREVNTLNSKLLSLQLDIKNLHDVCKRQGKTLQENQLCVEEAMLKTNHNKKQAQALVFTDNQIDFRTNKQYHLRQLQQLKKKLLTLQQELEFRTQELQASYCSLLQYQSILEKQTSDLLVLHHHCKLKEDEVILYEEEMGSHNKSIGEKLHLAQEQLALAGDKIISLERSLNLYRDKYQTSLSNIELLECQVKMLEGELSGLIGQDPENKGDHTKVQIYTSPCVIQEHQETLKRLSEVWQKVSEQDDLIQELRNKLACSNSLVLEREEALIKLQAEFASYTATHRHPPTSSEDCEDIRKILKHLQEQKDSQCLHVEEYQNLVKDLRTELEAVSEQKKKIMKDMMKLELDLHELREETSNAIEKKDKETVFLQYRLQDLQQQYTESQKLSLKKDKLLQDKDEKLQELEKNLAQMQNTLREKEAELEKLQNTTKELDANLQEVRQSTSKIDSEALRAEIQKLKESLEEAREQLKVSDQNLTQCKEEAHRAASNLEDAHRKLENCLLQDKQKEDIIKDLQNQVQKLQKETLETEEEKKHNRQQLHELNSELSEGQRRLSNAEKEKLLLQKILDEDERKIDELLRGAQVSEQKQRDLTNSIRKLEEELQEVKGLLEEKREQLKKSKEQEKALEGEIEALRQDEKTKDKMAKEHLRKLEEERENLQAELSSCSSQLDSFHNKYNNSQKVIQELNTEIARQKDSIMILQTQLDSAIQKEKNCLQNMISKEAYDDLVRKSGNCEEDLTQALEKLTHATSETKNLQRSLQQTQERKAQLEDEISAYEERMKKLNMELKKLQSFQQQSELEVHNFDKKLEEMSNQVLQWQMQHQSDLKMLAAKEAQLREFQEEMAALRENLLADEKESPLPAKLTPKETSRHHRDNDQIINNVEQWAKEQKIANEKLGNKLREQVKYIAKLTGEKDHLHNVMVHLQQENKKLKNEIEEKKLKARSPRICNKVPAPCKLEPTPKGKLSSAQGWRRMPQDLPPKIDLNKYIGLPHC